MNLFVSNQPGENESPSLHSVILMLKIHRHLDEGLTEGCGAERFTIMSRLKNPLCFNVIRRLVGKQPGGCETNEQNNGEKAREIHSRNTGEVVKIVRFSEGPQVLFHHKSVFVPVTPQSISLPNFRCISL